ncbi:MAG: HIT family protein [Gammaproteobacteria bacterium]|jgi:diadenosine tetraphosphate (Ap4A) HIT family hydrolase|nr:HIT family protein [Gammaproteobacteria bacterium]MBT7307367.1 HIT family protein [Gammaproteobacteria bacterium]
MSNQADCFLCRLPGERILDECELTRTIRDGFEVSPGHSLIIPKRHVASYFALTIEEHAALSAALQRAKQLLDEEFHPDSYTIGINDGISAGQSIPHLHIHLIPRYQGDVENPRGGVRWVLPERADYWTK